MCLAVCRGASFEFDKECLPVMPDINTKTCEISNQEIKVLGAKLNNEVAEFHIENKKYIDK